MQNGGYPIDGLVNRAIRTAIPHRRAITMAKVTYRVDDLDGKTEVTGDSTTLSLNGRTVTIDLSEENVDKLNKLLAKYFANGVEVKRAAKANGSKSDADRTAEIRAWALANGHEVSDRGRLPGKVVEAYEVFEANSLVPVNA